MVTAGLAVPPVCLTAREAAPEHIAAYIRGHWGIEVRHEVALFE
jgi:hypothetical protein